MKSPAEILTAEPHEFQSEPQRELLNRCAMGKRKCLPPRRLRMRRSARLQSAKHWLGTYKGKCIILGYSNWCGVDYICSIKELQSLGTKLDQRRIEQLKASLTNRTRQRERRKAEQENRELQYRDSDENFSYIAGYTPAGFPYGLTWKESDPTGHLP